MVLAVAFALAIVWTTGLALTQAITDTYALLTHRRTKR